MPPLPGTACPAPDSGCPEGPGTEESRPALVERRGASERCQRGHPRHKAVPVALAR